MTPEVGTITSHRMSLVTRMRKKKEKSRDNLHAVVRDKESNTDYFLS